MSQDRFFMLEMDLPMLVETIKLASEIIAQIKHRPEILKFVPDDPEDIMITLMRATVARHKIKEQGAEKQSAPPSPEAVRASEEATRKLMEELAKAAGKQ